MFLKSYILLNNFAFISRLLMFRVSDITESWMFIKALKLSFFPVDDMVAVESCFRTGINLFEGYL